MNLELDALGFDIFFSTLFIFDEAENYLQSSGTPNNTMENLALNKD